MKVVFISTMLPSGHYSQIICSGLSKIKDIELKVYADKNPKNLEIKGCGTVKAVFSKSPSFIWEIFSEIRKDKPDIVHLQQEMNMYGSPLTAVLFPFLVLLLRLMGYRTVVTLHAAVFKKQIDTKFIELFHQASPLAQPVFLKVIFHWVFSASSLFANKILLHTHLHEKIFKEYGVDLRKVVVIPDAIPVYKTIGRTKKPYFFYFGHMVRRKGLGYALDGFKKFIAKNPKTKFKLVMAGGVIRGQEKAFDEIKNDIARNNLSKYVDITGFIEQDVQDKLYSEAYVAIIPAIISMGSSGPLFHANGYHKCTIATREGHFIEDIDEGKTGILTDNKDWDKAFQLVVDNPKLVQEIETNVARKARERTPLNTAKKYLEIYTSL